MSSNDSGYKRLREKYDKLLKETGNDTKNLSTIQDMGIRDNGIPDFLYSSDMDRKLDAYLRKNPKSAEFIYRKYQENHSLMKDICDPIPGNPLYVKEVADLLSEYFQYEDIRIEASRLKSEIPKLKEDVSSFKEERTTLEKETDELSKALESAKKELEETQKQLINVHTQSGIDKIMQFINAVQTTTNAILYTDSWSELQGNFRSLDREKIMKMEELFKTSNEVGTYMKSKDFISQNNIDTEQQKLMDEHEQVKSELEAWMHKNPSRQMDKIDDRINYLCNYVDQSTNRVLTEHVNGMITGKANEVREITSEIRTQIAMAKEAKNRK